MGSSPTENNLDVDNKSSQVLRTPAILRIILFHFSNPELLKLSLVNKLWKNEAQTVLRNRGNLYAKIRSKHPCQDLIAFASDLRQMNVVPFSGIKIDLMSWCDGFQGCVASQGGGWDPSYDTILDRVQLNYLSVRFHFIYERSKHCPAFAFVKKILRAFGGGLQTLSLNIEFGRADFIQQVLQDCSFSGLKTLRLKDRNDTTSEEYSNLIKALVSRSPNLHRLHIQGERVDLTENLLKGSSAHLLVSYDVCPTVHEISQSLVFAFRTTRVQLREVRDGLSPHRNLITSTLLRLSNLQLKSMDIDAAFLVPLTCYKICFGNVTEFRIHFNCLKPFQPPILRLIEEFDFTKIFPRLTKVESFGGSKSNSDLQDQMIEMIEQWNPTFNQRKRDRAVNITELILHFGPAFEEQCSFGFLPTMLPHVEKLSLDVFRGKFMPTPVWEHHWKNLKELYVLNVESKLPTNANLDSALCGIFPEEVAELREKDDEYLKAVNIVPVMPSIVCLKGLRTFTFKSGAYGFPYNELHEGRVIDKAYMFSKVTGLVAFKRCPDLSVTLNMDDYEMFEALNHLKSYARVVYGTRIIGCSREESEDD